jgi:hypothetical protein
MAYYVRLLTPSTEIVPFSEIQKQGKSIRLISGTDASWDKIEVHEPAEKLLAVIERLPVSSGSRGEIELARLKESLQSRYPVNAREWTSRYLSTVKTVYTFQIHTDDIKKLGWQTLGRIQNLLKDTLTGIIQADNEGYYNEEGDYILWQMYSGAGGTIPAATLDENGNWIKLQLNLNNTNAVDMFKQGIPPSRKGLFSRLLGG